MEQEALRDIWAELCFHLSDNVNPSTNENVFEQKVLLILEKLGWNQFRGEIKVKPSLQIGRQNFIIPDIVVYTPDNRAVLVLEIKRPVEDLSKPGSFQQLQSYMRQTRADFGLLIGREIHVYYHGDISPNRDLLLLSKIRFKSDSAEGINFVELFNKNSFITGKYESYLKAHIAQLELDRKINVVKERLRSEETSEKMVKLLQHEFEDVETQVLTGAMKGLTIKISYEQYDEKNKSGPPHTVISKEPQETVFVCKNKTSGQHFIYIEDSKDHEIRLIKPDGVLITLSADLFEQPKEERIDYLLSYKLITEIQLEKYNEYELQEADSLDASIEDYPDRIKIKRVRTAGDQSNQSEAAYIKAYRRQLKNANSLPSRIKEYVKERRSVTYSDLRRICVVKFGCKSESSGSIGASVKVLEVDGYVRVEGYGDSKRITYA